MRYILSFILSFSISTFIFAQDTLEENDLQALFTVMPSQLVELDQREMEATAGGLNKVCWRNSSGTDECIIW